MDKRLKETVVLFRNFCRKEEVIKKNNNNPRSEYNILKNRIF